jgi:hypothetical protein
MVRRFCFLNELITANLLALRKPRLTAIYNYMMPLRNLFYRALTRTRTLAIVLSSKKAISLAVRTTNDQQRYTRLWQRLRLPTMSVKI